MNLFWSRNPSVPNFGDDINPFIFSKLLGADITYVASNYQRFHSIGIGSILSNANKYSEIIGTGFIKEEDVVIEPPRKIIAVRGKETRNKLISMGIQCPEVYGDAALLFPKFYNPVCEKKYTLGIIPHYIDKQIGYINKLTENITDVKIIDIQNNSHLKFIDEVLSCELIASSTLHGMIIADAYCIPSIWIEFSKNVIGDGFKFRDYFSSVGRRDDKPIQVNDTTTIQEILDRFQNYKIEFDSDKLINIIRKSM